MEGTRPCTLTSSRSLISGCFFLKLLTISRRTLSFLIWEAHTLIMEKQLPEHAPAPGSKLSPLQQVPAASRPSGFAMEEILTMTTPEPLLTSGLTVPQRNSVRKGKTS